LTEYSHCKTPNQLERPVADRMKRRRVLGISKAFSRHSNRVDVEILELFPGQKIAQRERPTKNCSLLGASWRFRSPGFDQKHQTDNIF